MIFKKTFNVNHVPLNIDLALLLARIMIGLLMLSHGIPKLDMLDANPVQFADLFGLGPEVNLYLAIFAEVGCSVLVMLGFYTRLAVIPLISTMLVAAFYIHANDSFAQQEMALHFVLTYVMLLIMGSGKYSLDNVLYNNPE
ncbi:hypothetical protein D9M68_444370 [compost metagenome]